MTNNTESNGNHINNKARQVYGEAKLEKQQLYERWSVKDHWNLKAEAIPLVLGFDPQEDEYENNLQRNKEIEDLFSHAKKCIRQERSLTVKNLSEEEDQWQVVPAEFYQWASVSRIEIPEQLSALMEFIISTVKTSGFVSDSKEDSNVSPEAVNLSQQFNQETELVLGAALAVLMNKKDECQNSKGRIDISKIVKLILENEKTWFSNTSCKLSQTTMEDLLKKWKGSLR